MCTCSDKITKCSSVVYSDILAKMASKPITVESGNPPSKEGLTDVSPVKTRIAELLRVA